jgi:hypothetical protein
MSRWKNGTVFAAEKNHQTTIVFYFQWCGHVKISCKCVSLCGWKIKCGFRWNGSVFLLYLKNASVCEFVAEKRLLCISVRNFSPIFWSNRFFDLLQMSSKFSHMVCNTNKHGMWWYFLSLWIFMVGRWRKGF